MYNSYVDIYNAEHRILTVRSNVLPEHN